MLVALAATGWAGVVVLGLVLWSRPLRMLPMKVVFWAFRVPAKDQIAWAKREASRDRLLDALSGFWDRPVRRRDATPVKRLGPRRADDEDDKAA